MRVPLQKVVEILALKQLLPLAGSIAMDHRDALAIERQVSQIAMTRDPERFGVIRERGPFPIIVPPDKRRGKAGQLIEHPLPAHVSAVNIKLRASVPERGHRGRHGVDFVVRITENANQHARLSRDRYTRIGAPLAAFNLIAAARGRKPTMLIHDLGILPYRDAWSRQEAVHRDVMAGGEECLLLVEHPPVITFGRRPGVEQNLRAAPDDIAARSVEIVQSDRGGDITFHGPGQLVVYPIIRLADHGFSVSGYVHALEAAVISLLEDLNIPARTDPAAIGVWTEDGGLASKICAIGVRIRRGVTLHGLALNVTTDLSYFDLIVPCGLNDRPVTSVARLLGDRTPPMEEVKQRLARLLFRPKTRR